MSRSVRLNLLWTRGATDRVKLKLKQKMYLFDFYRYYPFVDIFILTPGGQARCPVKGAYHKLESSDEAG